MAEPVVGAEGRVFGGHWFVPGPTPTLFGARCPDCGRLEFPPRRWCPVCGRENLEVLPLSREGIIETFTTVHVGPAGFGVPYTVGIVRLAEGLRVAGPLRADEAPVGFGRGVELEAAILRQDGGVPVLGYRFRTVARAVRVSPAPRPQPAIAPVCWGPRAGVYVAGVGMVPFGKYPDRPAEELLMDAALRALADAGIDGSRVQAIFASTAFGGTAAGQRLLKESPWGGRPVINVENACASGTTALIEAASWIEAGRCDVALVVGFDRVASEGSGLIPLPPNDPLAGVGVTLPALYALLGNHYLHESGGTAEQLANVVVKSRRHAEANPYAYMRKPVTVAEVLAARPIAEPLTLYMCTPNADGAAAAVLVSEAGTRLIANRPVRLRAAAIRAGLVQDRLEEASIVARVAREAYEVAGVGPEDVDLAEVHDAFAPAEPILIEKLGFAPHGEALRRLAAGHYRLGGPGVTVNPSGGLLSRGHPPGATGLAQVFEVVTQLRGLAGSRQVTGARVGLVHNQGGTVLELETNACVVLILSR